MLFALKLLAILGLLFYLYAVSRILKTWQRRDRLNVTIWFVILSLLGGVCIGVLFMR